MSMALRNAAMRVEETQVELRHAREYRQGWTLITAASAALTGIVAKLAPKVPDHPYEIHGPLGIVVVVGALATLGAATQILDGFDLVRSRKQSLQNAKKDEASVVVQAAAQPELPFAE